MNNQRSRSRQKPNPYLKEENQKYYSTNNYQRPYSSIEKINEDKLIQPSKQYNKNTIYPSYQPQFKRSPSPINTFDKQSKIEGAKQASFQYQGGKQKTYLKDANLKKVEKIQQFEGILKSAKKPFQSSDIPVFQSIFQRLSTKYMFDKIYSTFLYFFAHYCNLDEHIYRMFYNVIAKGIMIIDSTDISGNPLVCFYEMLITCTVETIYCEFKSEFIKVKNQLNVTNYFTIQQQLRQIIFNKSINSAIQGGPSIRNVLTLIRKSMERQKPAIQRSADFIHPIRQILKLLRILIKQKLQRIFLKEDKNPIVQQQVKERQLRAIFELIIFSQLLMIIYPKYKHHLSGEYEDFLNEMTILKMKISQVKQLIDRKIQNLSLKRYSNHSPLIYPNTQQADTLKQVQLVKDLQQTCMKLKTQHDSNYLYLLFVINLSTYNRNSIDGQKFDSTIFSFFLEPLIDQFTKSSDFLAQKKQQNHSNLQKFTFFLSTVKNYGLYHSLKSTQNLTDNQNLLQFVNFSYSHTILNTINFIIQNLDVVKQNASEKLVTILNSLSYKQSSFNKINECKDIKYRVQRVKNPNSMEIQQQNSLKQTHLQDELTFLIEDMIKLQINSILKQQKTIISIFKNTNSKNQQSQNTQIYQQNQKQIKINIDKSFKKSLQNFVEIVKNLKSYFKTSQNYVNVLIFFYLIYKNKKFQQAYILGKKLKNLKIKLQQVKKSNKIIDQQDEVIESLTQDEKISMKINELIQKKIHKIKQINQFENILISAIVEQLAQNSNKELSSSLNIQNVIENLDSYDQLIVSNNKFSFIGYLLKSQQKYQHKMLCQSQKQEKTFLKQQNFYKKMIEQIQFLIKLIKNYLLLNQSSYQTKFNSTQKLINKKKIQLLMKQIDSKLQTILSQVVQIHNKCVTNQEHSVEITINLQIIIETLLIKLFHLQQQKQQFIQSNQTQIHNNEIIKKQDSLRKKLTSQINLVLNHDIQNIQKSSIYTSKQQILSHVLTKIYKKFTLCSFQKTSYSQSASSLEQILVLKLKKCISLFYDKINEYMLNNFILSKRLFILQCMTITFYKMKPLAEMILNKYYGLEKLQGSNLCPQMCQFVQYIFFFIPNQQAIQTYLKFITTKDKFFIKTQLKKYEPVADKQKLEKLMMTINTM